MNEARRLPRWRFPSDYETRSAQALDTALGQVGMYRAWRHLDPGAACSVDARYAALPALTKRDLRTHFPNVLPPDRDLDRAVADREVELVQTSGTTDDKVTNIWNQPWWDASERASWKLNAHMAKLATGDHREAILVNPKNVGIMSDEIDLPFEARRVARYLYLNEKTDPLAWTDRIMDRMIDEMDRYQPAILEGNPSYLARLARYITASSQAVFQPGVIVFTYEYPTRFHQDQIRRAFSVPMVSSYGTTEVGYVFMQCEAGRLHQNSGFCRVDFQPLRPEHGGPLLGRILVTPFDNPWSCLVRFDTGDLVRLEESGRCPCGRDSGMILASTQGRAVNLTLTQEGRLVTLGELDSAVSRLEGVDEYKLAQVDPASYELHVASRRTDKGALRGEAVEVLTALYGRGSRVSVVFEDGIAPEASGKYLLARALFPIDVERYLDV